ncbi:MAG: ATP-binding protein [Prevotellaceae bacterium]|jgi:hypothetical protein|nr:ATP-binding protein [Prevotellaceae bacterium]
MSTLNVKRLPYGISNFEDLITENYAYVDKTQFIALLENESNPYQFFIRPRKFGKSLFFSLLFNYYGITKANKFEQLFGNLYIGKNPTPKKNAYAIMLFNFSGIDTSSEEEFRSSFSFRIKHTVHKFLIEHHNLFPNTDALIQKVLTETTGIDALSVAYNAAQSAGVPIFAIIDEYDHFANDLIAMGGHMGKEVYKAMVQANGLVRDFYEMLKIGTSDVLKRIFITGISPVMLNDLTSGFNIAANLTLNLKYNEMMGFTQEEVYALMKETGVNPDLINVDMKLYYDGYLFHAEGEHHVYNPAMILFFFNQLVADKKPPRQLVDDNLKTDYGRLQRLAENENNRIKLMEITKNNSIVSEIISQFSLDRMYSDEYFVSLLLYMGLLTIDKFEEGAYRLKIPNYSIQTLYWEYIVKMIADMNREVVVDTSAQNAALRELAYRGNPHLYVECISRNILQRLSNRDLIHFDEKYIKIMLLNGLFQSNLYIPISEKEVEGGYIDLFLQRSPLLPDIKYEWIWEVKYLKVEDEAKLPDKRTEAAAQLDKYRQSERFAGRSDLKYASLIFIGKDRYEVNERS